MTRRAFELLGDPVEHSVSPAMLRAAFDALGLEATYRARRTTPPELAHALRGTRAGGGGNVTLPHKGPAATLVDVRTPAVEATRACNCFWRDRDGRLVGDNTDVEGFLAAAGQLASGLPDGARILLVGAGGAARAVVHACALGGAATVEIINRTRARAEALAASARGVEARVVTRDEIACRYDLAVNATSLGLRRSDPLPIDPDDLDAGAVLDLVYAPGGTAWSRAAAARGVPAADGLEMLVRQAAASLRRWFPGLEPPLEAMREAARAALSGRAATDGGREDGAPR